jgi:hypothetical protein
MIPHQKIIVLLVSMTVTGFVFPVAFGHGVGYETLPPQMLGNRKVAMEVSSTINNATNQKQVNFSMFDTSTGLTVRDVTYNIKVIKNNQTLFEGIYKTKNGVLSIALIPDKNEKITAEEKKSAGIFDLLIGTEKSTVEAKGKLFEEGGLYKFSIDIISAENYSSQTQIPVRFESGISFAQSVIYAVSDDEFGKQDLKIISYYDLLNDVNYDQKTKSVFFSMPFEWTKDNINQTSVIHQEVFIPKTFGALQVSEYEVSANGFVLPDNVLTIDDYAENYRVIHILLYQAELLNLYGMQKNVQPKINFSLMPKSDDLLLVGVTDNVEYKVAMTTATKQILPGRQVTLLFKIFDVFLQGKTVSVNYDLSIKSGDAEVYKTSGVSSDSKDQWNEAKLILPENVEKKLTITFDNLGGNKLAKTKIPLTVSHIEKQRTQVPTWIKNNAGWWCQKLISDEEFLRGIEYLISKDLIHISTKSQNPSQQQVPEWVRNNSCWWANNSISDGEFVNGITYLVEKGVIKS